MAVRQKEKGKGEDPEREDKLCTLLNWHIAMISNRREMGKGRLIPMLSKPCSEDTIFGILLLVFRCCYIDLHNSVNITN